MFVFLERQLVESKKIRDCATAPLWCFLNFCCRGRFDPECRSGADRGILKIIFDVCVFGKTIKLKAKNSRLRHCDTVVLFELLPPLVSRAPIRPLYFNCPIRPIRRYPPDHSPVRPRHYDIPQNARLPTIGNLAFCGMSIYMS